MYGMHASSLVLCTLLLLVAGAPARATAPWIPEEGDLYTTSGFVYETFDEMYKRKDLESFPPGTQNQFTGFVQLEYGFWNDLAADARIGYTGTTTTTFADKHGLDDTRLGIRWRILDEFDSEHRTTPTLTARVGGIIAGTYDDGVFPTAPGDGGNGVEFGLAAGKLLGHGFVLSGSGGYRIRDNKIPDEWELRLTAAKTFFEWLSLSAGFHHKASLSGVDLGDPTFTPDRAPELRETPARSAVGTWARSTSSASRSPSRSESRASQTIAASATIATSAGRTQTGW
jgi:hypothetical protein